MTAENNYTSRTDEKRAIWSMKISPKTKYLASIAARAHGKTLSNYVEATLEKSFASINITDEQEPDSSGKRAKSGSAGKTLAKLADSLYAGNEAQRFLSLVHTAPWLATDGEQQLLRIIQHSDYFAPLVNGDRALSSDRVQEQWTLLAAIRDGEADMDILPADQRPSKALAFGLVGDAGRVALYKSDPEEFKRVSAAYKKAMKGGK